jgi:dinuclear metal center YbgI/SA1388 family protein
MTVGRDELIAFLDAELGVAGMRDWGPNGLQVHGTAREVACVATAVTATRATIEGAERAGAQVLVVHHGLFWHGATSIVDEALRRRLEPLFRAGISLAAYHLPLDAHPVHGNNAGLARALGLTVEGAFAEAKGTHAGLWGSLPAPLDASGLRAAVAAACGRDPLVLGTRTGSVSRVGLVSGAGARSLAEAATLGLDALVTGEAEVESAAVADELGLLCVAAGHHATERFGVRAVGLLLEQRFGVESRFLDEVNPV